MTRSMQHTGAELARPTEAHLDARPGAEHVVDATPTNGRTPILETRGLVKRFGPTEALRGVDVQIAPGELVAVMGPSGSGKSTLLHCMAAILAPDGGQAIFDGTDLGILDEGARSRLRRTSFGFVFQFGQLVPDLPAVENIALPLLLNGARRSDALPLASEWMRMLDLEGLEARLPGELSGGQAQRIALARALVIEPRVIFADEPTGALDSLAGEVVMDILTGTARERGTTVVIVTHDARVAAYADRAIVVRDGQIVGPGGLPS